MEYHKDMDNHFTAGAFRDCTRIANINPALWSELFLMNDEYILPHLRTYIGYLEKMETAVPAVTKRTLPPFRAGARQQIGNAHKIAIK